MILIVVKYRVKPEAKDTFLDAVADFTAATRAEPGNLWFEWSRSVERDDEFVLVEAFQDGTGEAHVNSCLLYTSPSPRDGLLTRMPSSA